VNQLPNIIFILADQQRWDTVGCYGQKLNVTPNLDKMASKGIRFENAFTCQPVCGPARSCIQTGKYATQTGCYRNEIALPQDEKTIAHWFLEIGYKVGYVGKWHLASTLGESNEKIGKKNDYTMKAIPLERRGGYKDYWIASDLLEFTSHSYGGFLFDKNMNKVEFNCYRADAITNYALDFIRQQNKTNPFFLFISYLEPHHQNDINRYKGPKGSRERFKNFEVPGDLLGTKGDWRKNFADYLGSCNSIDYNIGRILDELETIHLIENTVLFYTSDHGSHFRTRNQNIKKGRDDYKRSCHEASIRIPMIVYGPNFKGGRVIDELVSLIDVPPTLLSCASIFKPDYMQGRKLQDLVRHNINNWSEEIFIQISESQVGRAIRTKRWKYSVRAPEKDGMNDSHSNVYIEDFLYDLKVDPYEKVNLVGRPQYRGITDQLREKLKTKILEIEEKESEIKKAPFYSA